MVTLVAYGGGKLVPGFGEWIVPTYAAMIGFEMIYKNNEPVVTWKGFYQCMQPQFKAMPNEKFLEISRVISKLGISMPQTLARTDFPAIPNPVEEMKAVQVKNEMFQGYFRWRYGNTYSAQWAGYGGLGGSGLPVNYGVGANSQLALQLQVVWGSLHFRVV